MSIDSEHRTGIRYAAMQCGSATATPTDTEFGIEVDRSFQDFIVDLGLGFDLPRHWEARLNTKLRRRHYTTDVSAETTHFDRTDTLWSIGAQIGKHFSKNLYLGAEAGWNDNNSDRSDDASVESDEVGYREFIVGLTGEWRF